MLPEDLDPLRRLLDEGRSVHSAIESLLGGKALASGFWRIFSAAWPSGGAAAWNGGDWRGAWADMSAGFYCVGEDVFGNQLALVPNGDEVYLWDHETGALNGLHLDPLALLESVVVGGVGWIDAYANGCLEIAGPRVAALPLDSHLHWVVPLALGGGVSEANLAPIERTAHLIGHAKLWRQVGGVAPGTRIVVR